MGASSVLGFTGLGLEISSSDEASGHHMQYCRVILGELAGMTRLYCPHGARKDPSEDIAGVVPNIS